MKIKDLRAGMDGVTTTGHITKISEKMEVETKFGKSHLAVALLADETGSIRLRHQLLQSCLRYKTPWNTAWDRIPAATSND